MLWDRVRDEDTVGFIGLTKVGPITSCTSVTLYDTREWGGVGVVIKMMKPGNTEGVFRSFRENPESVRVGVTCQTHL